MLRFSLNLRLTLGSFRDKLTTVLLEEPCFCMEKTEHTRCKDASLAFFFIAKKEPPGCVALGNL